MGNIFLDNLIGRVVCNDNFKVTETLALARTLSEFQQRKVIIGGDDNREKHNDLCEVIRSTFANHLLKAAVRAVLLRDIVLPFAGNSPHD